jgi:hypothetical protein
MNVVNNFPPQRIHYKDIDKFNTPEDNPTAKTPEERRRELDPLTEYNRFNLTVIYPNLDTDTQSSNYDPDEAWSYGCQFVSINYQLNDFNRKKYIERFKFDSIYIKPLSIQKEPRKLLLETKTKTKSSLNTDNIDNIDIDNLLPPSKDNNDRIRSQLSVFYDNQPIYLRPIGDLTKVLSIDNKMLLDVKTKRDDELDIEDGFLIRSSLSNKNNRDLISLESIKYSNRYLIVDGNNFIVKDIREIRTEKEPQRQTILLNGSYVPMKSILHTRIETKDEDEDKIINFYIQGERKNLMVYNPTSNRVQIKTDDEFDYTLASQASFYFDKLPVETAYTIRQTDGLYVHIEKTIVIKNINDLLPNAVFEFLYEDEMNIKIDEDKNPTILGNLRFIHIKDNLGNFWNIEKNKNTLKSNSKIPSKNSRFILEKDTNNFSKFIFGGNNQRLPLYCQKDGILRLAYNNEIDKQETLFIISNIFKKKKL